MQTSNRKRVESIIVAQSLVTSVCHMYRENRKKEKRKQGKKLVLERKFSFSHTIYPIYILKQEQIEKLML